MATLKKYDLEGKELEGVEIDDKSLEFSANMQMIKDYLVAIRSNARQWSANTKGRSEVNHSNIKPRPQKGTGRARQGTLSAAQFRGGGIVFGPKPKFNQHIRINKKERRAAIRYLFSEKISSGHVILLKLDPVIEVPKTKSIARFLDQAGVKHKKTLFLGDSQNVDPKNACQGCENFIKSMRNVPKTKFLPFSNVNGYDLVNAQEIVVIDTALEHLMKCIGSAA